MDFNFNEIIFSQHAIQRMFEREISKNNIIEVIENGTQIMDYPNDTPYPSKLILGYVNKIPIHIVLGINQEEMTGIIITTYIPTLDCWENNYKRRK